MVQNHSQMKCDVAINITKVILYCVLLSATINTIHLDKTTMHQEDGTWQQDGIKSLDIDNIDISSHIDGKFL